MSVSLNARYQECRHSRKNVLRTLRTMADAFLSSRFWLHSKINESSMSMLAVLVGMFTWDAGDKWCQVVWSLRWNGHSILRDGFAKPT